MASFEQISRLIERYNLEEDDRAQRILKIASQVDNPELFQKLVETIAAQQNQNPFPQPETKRTGVRFGTTKDGTPLRIPLEDLTRHMLIAGSTGTGKTDQILSLISNLQRHDVSWWVFDTGKKEFRHLASQENTGCIVIQPRQLRLNLLRPPPNVHPRTWLTTFAEIFCDSVGLLDASFLYLLDKAEKVFHERGVFSGEANHFPTLEDVLKEVEGDYINYTRVLMDYRDRVYNRLQGVQNQNFSSPKALSLEELAGRNVVFELDSFKTQTQNVVMELLQAWYYLYRKNLPASQVRETGLDHVLVYDEAYTMYHRDKERETVGAPEIDKLTAQIRALGVGVVLATQVPEHLTDFSFANTNTKVLMQSVDSRQSKRLSDSIGLDQRQRQVAHHLEVGEAVLKNGSRGPFLVEFPRFGLDKDVDPEFLDETYSDVIESLLISPSPSAFFPPSFEERENRRQPVKVQDVGGTDVENGENLSEDELKFLKSIVERPFVSAGERYNLFSSTGKGYNVRSSLESSGLIRSETLADPFSHGSKVFTFFEITEKGRERLESQDIDVVFRGRGGVRHRYFQHRISSLLETWGWKTELEGKDVDVYAEKDGSTVGFEVALSGHQREVQNAEKDVELADHVYTAAVNDKVLEKLEDSEFEDSSWHLVLIEDVPSLELLS